MKSKKPIILITSLVLIILIAIIISTQTNTLDPEQVISEDAPENHPTGEVDISSVHRFIDNIEFGIGDSTEELVEKWGPPLEVDYIYGGLYLKYENVVFYTDSYLNYDENYKYAYISWEDKYLEEYDGSGNPFRFSFSLVNGGDRIWKVAFRPMQ